MQDFICRYCRSSTSSAPRFAWCHRRTDGVDLSCCRRIPNHPDRLLEDVRPAVAGVAAVAPLRSGGGTRLKILEAMALGTPVVATSKARGLQ